MTGQLYNDLQGTIRGIFFVVPKVQDHCPATPVFLGKISTHALETIFAVVRTLAHDSNIDGRNSGIFWALLSRWRKIYAKHPSWSRNLGA